MANNLDEEEGERCEEDDLEKGVYGNQDSAVFVIASSLKKLVISMYRWMRLLEAYQPSPYQHHRYTSCYTDENESFSQALLIWQESPRKSQLAQLVSS